MDGEDLEALGLQESEEEIKIDDLDIDQLIAESEFVDPYKPPKIGNFILIGFPQTEIHCQKLKEHGLDFDRVVFLTDQAEDEPGKILMEREPDHDEQADCLYDWEAEQARCAKIMEHVKETLGEENLDSIKEVDCSGDPDRVFIKIRTALDPFFLQADNPDDVKRTEELNLMPEEDPDEEADYDKRLPKSDFGDYCPVTFVKDGYMVKGDAEFEQSVYGKTFRFAGEAEQVEFLFNPSKFLSGE